MDDEIQNLATITVRYLKMGGGKAPATRGEGWHGGREPGREGSRSVVLFSSFFSLLFSQVDAVLVL